MSHRLSANVMLDARHTFLASWRTRRINREPKERKESRPNNARVRPTLLLSALCARTSSNDLADLKKNLLNIYMCV